MAIPVAQQPLAPSTSTNIATGQARTFSSTFLKPFSPPPSSSSVSLRRLSAPFLLLCHPDKISSSSPDLRETHLRATQTLNGLIDTVEALYDRCGGGQSVSTQPAGRIELQGRYEVEFLVPCSSDDDLVGGSSKKKKRGGGDRQTSYTRRSIIITYPASLRDDVQIVDGSGRYSLAAAAALRRRTAKEIVRLLKVAGASVPEDVLSGLLNDAGAGVIDGEHGAASYGHEDYLVDEMDLGGLGVDTFLRKGRFRGASDASGSRRPRTRYEKSREAFVKSVDWAELRRRTEDALQDAEADMATSRIMKRDERRKEQMISNVLSRVTVDANPVRESNENPDVRVTIIHPKQTVLKTSEPMKRRDWTPSISSSRFVGCLFCLQIITTSCRWMKWANFGTTRTLFSRLLETLMMDRRREMKLEILLCRAVPPMASPVVAILSLQARKVASSSRMARMVALLSMSLSILPTKSSHCN